MGSGIAQEAPRRPPKWPREGPGWRQEESGGAQKAPGNPRGVLNWPYARRNFKRNAEVRRVPPPIAPPAAKAKARPAPVVVRAPPPPKVKNPYPALQFRRWKGRMVAPIKPVLKAAKATDTGHMARRCQRWASSVPNGFADQAPRRGAKPGGKPEYVATDAVLKWIYDHE